MIWFASWFAAFGIWPIAHPEHTVGDVWFPLDLTLHLAGLAYVILYCRKVWRRALRDMRTADVTFGDLWDAHKRKP